MYQIFVVEDELLIRQSIRNMVEGLEGPYAFCGEASDGEMALSMMQDLMPDILLTDIKMPFLDGFELIRHARAIMPWLKVIIISGYDEFESAQKAIALGVDLYLLKPVRAADLVEAVHKMAHQLEQGKRQGTLLPGYQLDEVHSALRQQLLQQLFYGGQDTAQLLEKARALNLDIVHPFYQVVVFQVEGAAGGLYQSTAQLLDDGRSVLCHFNGSDKLVLLVFAKTQPALSEQVWRLVNILRHQLAGEGVVITTVIGNTVQRLSAVKDAFNTADTLLKKIHSVSAGQVIDVNDTAQLAAGIASFSSSFGERFHQRLLYAAVDEVPDMLEEYWHSDGGDQFNSMLYRYYTLVDILKTAVQVVAAAKPDVDQKDIAARFSAEYDVFAASGERGSFEQTAQKLLQQAVAMKQENLGFLRHSHVITKAEEYIARHYCDPNISLISTARHVGLSAAHFSTIFSQTTGRTFISYLTHLRLQKAKQLLAQTDQKLSAIAMEIGYNEPNYFSHVFKKNEGVTPKEYRNAHRGG